MMDSVDFDQLRLRRLESWCQDGIHRIVDPAAAKQFINLHGIVTHYASSSEVPNLFDGYMSEPKAKVEPSWDSPSGHVYGWRWDIGRSGAAFYSALVARKPTWISWDVLPYILGFAMERREPEHLYEDGLLSNDAIRIVRAYEGTSGVLSTKDLRVRAGFPTGKQNRAAYLKAVDELDGCLLLAKVFDREGGGDEMSHALVRIKYPEYVSSAMQSTPLESLEAFLAYFLSRAIYVEPKVLARHLRVKSSVMDAAVDHLVEQHRATRLEGRVVVS